MAYTVKREEGVTVDLHLIPEATLLGTHLYPNAIKYSSHKRDRCSLRLSMNCRHGSSFASIAHSVATCIGGMRTSAMHVTSDTIVERGTHTCCMRKLHGIKLLLTIRCSIAAFPKDKKKTLNLPSDTTGSSIPMYRQFLLTLENFRITLAALENLGTVSHTRKTILVVRQYIRKERAGLQRTKQGAKRGPSI